MNNINDKEWLDRVQLAARHYNETNQAKLEAVNAFVKWLYALYGIKPPTER